MEVMKEDVEEVYSGSGLMWRMVGDAMGVDEVLKSRRSWRKVGLTFSREVREYNEEDFELHAMEDKLDSNEENICLHTRRRSSVGRIQLPEPEEDE